MDCPHCGKAFHDSWAQQDLEMKIKETEGAYPFISWRARSTICPSFYNPTIHLIELRHHAHNQNPSLLKNLRVYPANTFRPPTPAETPPDIKEDYEEACRVLPTSQKASAALSRRCLQAILQREGYTQKDLAKQIDALLAEPNPAKSIPTALRETVDAIRNFGNFSAHPITDQTTLQVVAVEPGEAEWCLDILEEMFDHYYVKPAQAAARKAALNAKLASAGKPRSK